jgi:hypothetical protein
MKEYYSPIKTKGRSGIKITIPNWVIVADVYKFERMPDGTLTYTPVVN